MLPSSSRPMGSRFVYNITLAPRLAKPTTIHGLENRFSYLPRHTRSSLPGRRSLLSSKTELSVKDQHRSASFCVGRRTFYTSKLHSRPRSVTTSTVSKMMSTRPSSEKALPQPLHAGKRRIFEPLNPDKREDFFEKIQQQSSTQENVVQDFNATKLRGIVFDVDGTLW